MLIHLFPKFKKLNTNYKKKLYQINDAVYN